MSSTSDPQTGPAHAAEIASHQRFPFGANWARFLRHMDAWRIDTAQASLVEWLQTDRLAGLRLLDAGSGSGLFSLVARRLGAQVHSFDFDPQSVACTRELRRRHLAGELPGARLPAATADRAEAWLVEEGSVLDREYLGRLGRFDVVYSWGVLHHTGDQWNALNNVSECVAPGGRLFIALYNDQGWLSTWWTGVKRRYNRHSLWRALFIGVYTPYFIWARWLYWQLRGHGGTERGMSLWYDLLDWLGGYPFEVSKPEQVLDFLRARGFELRKMFTAGGKHGCNQFVFERVREPGTLQDNPSTRA
jgi:2-polyprenyl-3-methyl-5-hydroxy-6-metoxy-1,4-benzoquinol methylase